MFQRIAAFVARHAKLVVLAWVLLAGGLFLTAPRFDDVATQDTSAFLSNDAPSVAGAYRLDRLWPKDEYSQSAAVVLARATGLTEADRAFARDLEAWLNGPDAPGNVRLTQSALSRPELADVLSSKDGRATIMIVGLSTAPFEPATNATVEAIRVRMREKRPAGLETHVTGNAGVAADQSASIKTAVKRTTAITLVLVVLILVWIFRSPVAPLVPLTTIGVAYAVALGLISFLAQAGLKVSSLVETFMVVIVFGAGTDYCLFIVSRYKEELHAGHDARRTLVGTMAIIGGVIASSAATVIVGFGTQGVARFGMFRTMGPAMAIAVSVTLLAGLTLTPALLRLLGRRAFWPQRVGVPGESSEEAARARPERRRRASKPAEEPA